MAIRPITPLQAFQRLQGVSQQELAARMEVSQTTVSCILRGVYAIDSYAEALAEALDVPLQLVLEAARRADEHSP